jgi:hypothetical protein
MGATTRLLLTLVTPLLTLLLSMGPQGYRARARPDRDDIDATEGVHPLPVVGALVEVLPIVLVGNLLTYVVLVLNGLCVCLWAPIRGPSARTSNAARGGVPRLLAPPPGLPVGGMRESCRDGEGLGHANAPLPARSAPRSARACVTPRA